MAYVASDGCRLYFEEAGEGVPILLIHPAGSTASTWGTAADELGQIGLLITYDRRGYARSGGEAVRSMATHSADAAALLEHLRVPPAVVVGTSAGAAIAVDLAVRRPDLVRVVIAHEFPWRFARHLPSGAQVRALAKIALLALRGRESDAAETLLRSAYTYRDGRSAWDAFPREWRQAGRDNARAALADFRNSIGTHPSAAELATMTVPVVCSYGERSPDSMVRRVRSLASAIPTATVAEIHGAGHAAPFDATTDFVQLIAKAISFRRPSLSPAPARRRCRRSRRSRRSCRGGARSSPPAAARIPSMPTTPSGCCASGAEGPEVGVGFPEWRRAGLPVEAAS